MQFLKGAVDSSMYLINVWLPRYRYACGKELNNWPETCTRDLTCSACTSRHMEDVACTPSPPSTRPPLPNSLKLVLSWHETRKQVGWICMMCGSELHRHSSSSSCSPTRASPFSRALETHTDKYIYTHTHTYIHTSIHVGIYITWMHCTQTIFFLSLLYKHKAKGWPYV